MAKYIQPVRIRAAIIKLAEWRENAKSQAAMHLLPLLALIEKGANKTRFVAFSEEDDRIFWDKYCRFPDENRPRGDAVSGFTRDYYIDPLVQSTKPSDYPHRSPSSIRKRTFLNSWHAVTFKEGNWKLAASFADIFTEKVLSKGEISLRIPVVDLALWLFRDSNFPNTSTAKTLEEKFQSIFSFEEVDYDKLFEFTDEAVDNLFTEKAPSSKEYREAIEQALVSESVAIDKPPPLYENESTTDKSAALKEDDSILLQVKKLLTLGTSGIIFRGCPGTSKTWYAKQIARHLVAKESDIYQVQFHPSYGYEDLVEGYRPEEDSKSGFKIVDKVFMDACQTASAASTPVVFIIDEINRGDPSRVLGELLTYIEHGYRNVEFIKAYSGKAASIPHNLVVFGTMNHFDKSITPLDFAFTRRFDFIDLKPDGEVVGFFLGQSAEFKDAQIDAVIKWFENLQSIFPSTTGGVGHTYFKSVRRPDQIHTVWQHRILPYCETVLELEPQRLENAKKSFDTMWKAILGQTNSPASA